MQLLVATKILLITTGCNPDTLNVIWDCLHAWVTVAAIFLVTLSPDQDNGNRSYQFLQGHRFTVNYLWHSLALIISLALTRPFHGGIYICFLLCNAMIIFDVHFSPLPMHSIIYCKKCVDFYLFWKMRNNNGWGGWAAPHQSPPVSSVSRRYWYYTVIQCQPQIALDLSSLIVIQCNLWPLWHQTLDTEQLLFSSDINNAWVLLMIHLITDELRYPSVLLMLLLCFWFTTAMSHFV